MSKNVTENASSFDAVYDGNAKILMMGTIPSAGGVKYGFFYMSKVNNFWKYLTQTLQTDDFVKLANDYRAHYNTDDCEYYKDKVKEALYRNHIALFDVIDTCERVGSADNQILSSKNNSSQSIKKILEDNPNIKQIFVNSYEVEKRLKQIFKEEGIDELQRIMKIDTCPYTRILSPSPMCKRTHSEKEILENWQILKQYLN
ncbi:MAG: hypothetical protein IKB42_05160 [Clostridia bacterium]|nr:hypothetical protein [Clostridia bacterium]